MTLTPKALAEYKAIYKKLNGKDLSDQEALEQASRLLRAFELVYRPIPKDKWEEFKKENPNIGDDFIRAIEGRSKI